MPEAPDAGDADFWEMEHVRLQQEEYDRVFAEEQHASRARRPHRAEAGIRDAAAEVLPAWIRAEDLARESDTDSMSEEEAARVHRHATSHPHRRRGAATEALARALDNASLDVAWMDPFMDLAMHDETAGMHALLHALMRTQDEADLQDAMRLSSAEAYSGSFSVAPVDESILQQVTTTSQFCSSDKQDQCSICLMDFEQGDSLRTLQCTHHFHMACVDQWLAQSGQCPVCKKQVGFAH
jgi:hypothetical protein